MTLPQAAELLAERAGRQFDLPFRLELQDMLVYWRARLLANTLEKKSYQQKFFLQSIVVPLIKVANDPCIEDIEGLDSCELKLVSTTTIPNTIRVGALPLKVVGGLSGETAFAYSPPNTESWNMKHRGRIKHTRYGLINRKLEIYNNLGLKKVRVVDIFADPREVAKFTCETSEGEVSCYNPDTDQFPIDEQTLQLCINAILTTELRMQPIENKEEIKPDRNV